MQAMIRTDSHAQKTVFITGAARRVGAAIALCLHRAGWQVVVHYRHNRAAAEALVSDMNTVRPQSAACVGADLLLIDGLPLLAANALACFGRIDALVNNASSFFPSPVGQIDMHAWTDLVGSNLQAPLFLTQALADELRARQGAVVNITDIHADRPMRGFPVYSVAKAGLVGLTKAMAVELAPEVRVNAVAPGPIAWPEGAGELDASEQERVREHTLLKRTGSPEDIAKAVRFLLDDAPFVTGQVLAVDGGRSVNL